MPVPRPTDPCADRYHEAWQHGYHLGYADGEGSMENINPQAEKWHAIFDEGWNGAWKSAKDQVLHIHKEWFSENWEEQQSVCEECVEPWPCPTALIFLPELLPEPPNLRPDLPF